MSEPVHAPSSTAQIGDVDVDALATLDTIFREILSVATTDTVCVVSLADVLPCTMVHVIAVSTPFFRMVTVISFDASASARAKYRFLRVPVPTSRIFDNSSVAVGVAFEAQACRYSALVVFPELSERH